MTLHPKERPGGVTRRDFLLRTAGAATLLSGAGGLLAACSSETTADVTKASAALGERARSPCQPQLTCSQSQGRRPTVQRGDASVAP